MQKLHVSARLRDIPSAAGRVCGDAEPEGFTYYETVKRYKWILRVFQLLGVFIVVDSTDGNGGRYKCVE